MEKHTTEIAVEVSTTTWLQNCLIVYCFHSERYIHEDFTEGVVENKDDKIVLISGYSWVFNNRYQYLIIH